jgi:hypothetical protein
VDGVAAEAWAPSGSCGELAQAERSKIEEIARESMIFIQASIDGGVWFNA